MKHSSLLVALAVGCGGAPAVPPQAAPDRAPPAPTLHLGVGGPVVGWITDADALARRSPSEAGDGWLALSLPVWSATSRSVLVVHARADALSADVPALPEPIRRASGHVFTIHLDDGTPVADFSCDEVEVLAEQAGRVRVRVRDDEGWVLEGWVPGTLAERGDGDCPPRVVPTSGPVPPGFVVASPPDPVPALDGTVWRLRGGECQRWEVRTTQEGLELERRTLEELGSGRAELIETQALHGGPLHYWKYGVSTERRWIREPAPEEGMPGLPGAIGAVFPMALVSVDEAAYTWIEAEVVFAFHPDDVRRWYRTEAACLPE